MNINIPLPHEVQDDLRSMIVKMAKEVIEEVKTKDSAAKPYMSIKETEKYLQISFNTLQKWESIGLKSIKIDGKKLYKKETIDEFMRTFEK